LPTPPLSNAPLVPIKKLQRVTQAIMDLLAMHRVKYVAPVPSQTVEQTLGQQSVFGMTQDAHKANIQNQSVL